jgi:hypothetical protein
MQLEGEEMDIEMEMEVYFDEERSSDVDNQGREEASSSSSSPPPRRFFRESTPFPSNALSDTAEDTPASSPEAQQLPEEESKKYPELSLE